MPEFIVPQDGTANLDCELAAAKRWLGNQRGWLQEQEAVILGDVLFSHQPFSEPVTDAELAFILVCKPSSHELLYQWLEGMQQGGTLDEIVECKWNGPHGEIWRFRWACDVPLRAGDGGMRVNWYELTISHETDGTRLYKNSFVTNLDADATIVKVITHAGRARWKHENEGHQRPHHP